MSLLSELPDDDRLALFAQTAGALGVPSAFFVEKDYWAMRTLRSLAAPFATDPDLRVVFKGGTSLSKGFGLIERFSEDIDVVLVPGSTPAKKAMKRDYLKPLTERVVADLGLVDRSGIGDGGSSESHYNSYLPFLAAAPAVGGLPRVLLEMSVRTQASAFPQPESRNLRTFVSEYLGEGASEFEDLADFECLVLPPVRTLIEKLCAVIGIHDSWSAGDSRPLQRGARHFYDIQRLLSSQDILLALGESDVGAICDMVRQITDANEYVTGARPQGGLGASPTFAPDSAFASAARREYRNVEVMVYGSMPSFDDCLDSVRQNAHLL